MPVFKTPMINLYARDLARLAAFYTRLGFVETFRTPATGAPRHLEFKLDQFTLGMATLDAAIQDHGLQLNVEGHTIEIVLWTNEVDTAIEVLSAAGAPILSAPHDFLDGKLRVAWSADPGGNPIQLVERKN